MNRIKTITVSVALLATQFINAQKTYFKEGQFDFGVSDSKKVYLTLDTNNRNYGIELKNEKDRSKFTSFLSESLSKYTEWSVKAKENNVKDFRKTINEVAFEGFFTYGKWKFGKARLRSIFYVNEDNKCILYIYGSKMKAYTNQYMESKSIIFELNEGILEMFTDNLSEETIENFLNNKSNNDALFE